MNISKILVFFVLIKAILICWFLHLFLALKKDNFIYLMNTLGKSIRLLRHQRGWSQEDVAKRLEISIPAFSKIETGITDVNLSRLNQISKLFGLSLVQLLSTSDPEEEKAKADEIGSLVSKLHEREAEVIELQKKVIDLYEKLHEK